MYCPVEFNDDRSETLYACVVHESSRDASVNKPLLLLLVRLEGLKLKIMWIIKGNTDVYSSS